MEKRKKKKIQTNKISSHPWELNRTNGIDIIMRKSLPLDIIFRDQHIQNCICQNLQATMLW